MPQHPNPSSDRPPLATGHPPASQVAVSPTHVLRVLLGAAALLTVLGIVAELARNVSAEDHDLLPRTLRVVRRNFGPSAEQTVGS